MSQNIHCPGPNESVKICVVKGFGSRQINITYFAGNVKDFATASSPGPWTVTVTVYKSDNTTLFTLTSPTRVTLDDAAPNIQFQFLDSDFTALSAALGNYTYTVDAVPTVGAKLRILSGRLQYTLASNDCGC